jgi:predicted phage terminase large subunit-like protein
MAGKNKPQEVRPQPRQELFLSTPADVAIFGGQAGGGKTYALLIEPLRHIGVLGFSALVFRRTFRQIKQPGGIWDEAGKLYPSQGGIPHRGSYEWEFLPVGTRIGFTYLENENDKYQYDGAQVPLICFDQLEHYSESQFFYMFARNRSMCGIEPYIRATCNPDPDSWLAKFLSWWINPETGYPIIEREGRLRWFVRPEDELVWGDSKAEVETKFPDLQAKSVTFIHSSVYDNPALLKRNPGYLASLMALPEIDKLRLLYGNWKARLGAGKLFNRDWYGIDRAAPAGGIVCRFWDFAATEKKTRGDDPDYTASVKIRMLRGRYWIEDCTAEQLGPADGERQFMNIVAQDWYAAARDRVDYLARWEVEPGSAGKREALRLVQMLSERMPGINALGIPSQGDKIQRAKALAAQSQAGNVRLAAGAWNDRWLTHMHNQPETRHDDIMDASAGAFNAFGMDNRGSGMDGAEQVEDYESPWR